MSRKAGAARRASLKGKQFAQSHMSDRQQGCHSHTSHSGKLTPWGSRLLWVFMPATCLATPSPPSAAEFSPSVSPSALLSILASDVSSGLHGHHDFAQAPCLTRSAFPTQEQKCTQVWVQGTAQCPQVTPFTTITLVKCSGTPRGSRHS